VAFYRRKLPHWHPADTSIFVTWRLYGSLPPNFSFAPSDVSSGQAFATADRHLDQALSGPVWLKEPRVARLVVESLLFGDRSLRQYDLQAYVV
jgi:putative transposase